MNSRRVTFIHDANGNMTTRTVAGVTYTQRFDVENRLETVTVNGQTTRFVYDADGNRLLTIQPGDVKVYTPFAEYEETVTGTTATQRSFYYLAGQLIAARVKTATTDVYTYAYADHLGSIVAWSWTGGTPPVNDYLSRYYPFGGYRTKPATTVNPDISDRGFTGHKQNNTGSNDLGLIYMNARYYLPEVGRFISADTIVPEPGNPQSYNRYTYGFNNPVKYSDPSGHTPWDILDVISFFWSAADFATNPSWANAGWLALDTVSLLPILPSVGSVRHGAKLINRLDNVGDATRIVGHLDDGAKALNYANRLVDIGSASTEGAKLVDELVAMGTHGSLETGAVVSLGHGSAVGKIPGYQEWVVANNASYLSLPEDVLFIVVW